MYVSITGKYITIDTNIILSIDCKKYNSNMLFKKDFIVADYVIY